MNTPSRLLLFSLALGAPLAKGATGEPAFTLRADPAREEVNRSSLVDVNLGSTPEEFVRLFVKQLTGQKAPGKWVAKKAKLLGTTEAPRRIDLALLLAQEAGLQPVWKYTDPWAEQIPLHGGPPRKVRREVGAVMMFFFTSPGRPNGGPGWANNHAPGMFEPAENLRFEGFADDQPEAGYYHPRNPGFWYQELRDARYAGLSFLLLNVYGPDLEDGSMESLRQALRRLRESDGGDVVGLGMFDDTWTWGQPYFGQFWEQKPDCRDVEATAQLLYSAKWKKFFDKVPREHWYLFHGRPFIYFYNNNTLQNRDQFGKVLARMKELFVADFGVEPFVAVDSAFNYPGSGIKKSSDIDFDWYTFDNSGKYSSSRRNGVTLSHCMPRWDSVSRHNNSVERRATPDDHLVKDDEILKRVLNKTRDDDLLVFATWNDLGEGTGINRCYDYWWDGQWRQPSHFMNLIRRSQAGEKLE